MKNFTAWFLSLLLLLSLLSNCAPIAQFVGIKLFYRNADLNPGHVVKDIAYKTGEDADPIKHKLDLFVPASKNWPVLVFIHGGGWTKGDKDLRVAGKDIYGNIGRFFAERGIGVAVINYRLLPNVTWQEQIQDAANAVAYVYKNISKYGGDPKSFFLSGHSAGAQLATRLALDEAPLQKFGLSPKIFTGVITLSGAALDLTDEVTFKLGGNLAYFRKRFEQGDTTEGWREAVSPLKHQTAKNIPPFLILYGASESNSLIRQSKLLFKAVQAKHQKVEIHAVPRTSHEVMALLMSRKNNTVTDSVLEFIKQVAPQKPSP